MHKVEEGGSFGETGLLNGHPRTASVVAISSELHLGVLDFDSFG